MNTLVLYDSQYGNTEKIAKTIGETLHATVKHVRDITTAQLKKFDYIIVGSPVHGGRATPELDEFLSSIPDSSLEGVKVAAFDTRFASEDHGVGIKLLMRIIRYAAERIAKSLQSKGGELLVAPMGFIVNDKEGPLKKGELERAKKWASGLVSANKDKNEKI